MGCHRGGWPLRTPSPYIQWIGNGVGWSVTWVQYNVVTFYRSVYADVCWRMLKQDLEGLRVDTSVCEVSIRRGSPTNSFFFNLLQRSQIILFSSLLPYVYSLIFCYSWSLVSGSLPCYFFKDDLKLSTQDFTCSENTVVLEISFSLVVKTQWCSGILLRTPTIPNDLTKVGTLYTSYTLDSCASPVSTMTWTSSSISFSLSSRTFLSSPP